MAGLLKYFRREGKQKLPVLPDPKGSLSEKVPSSSIELTNNVVHNILDKETMPRGGKRGEYIPEFNFHSEVLNRQACCRKWRNSHDTILCQSLS